MGARLDMVDKSRKYVGVQKDVLKALRRDKSQNWFSKKMGYSFNQFAKWESGKTLITWKEFIEVATQSGIDMAEVILHTMRYRGNPTHITPFVRYLVMQATVTRAARILGQSTRKIARLTTGKQDVRFVDVACLMESGGFLVPFIMELAKDGSLKGLESYYEIHANQRDLFYKHPICMAIMAYIHTHKYKRSANHSIATVAAEVGIDVKDASDILKRMAELNIITWSGTHYEPVMDMKMDFSAEWTGVSNIIRFCLQRMIDRFSTKERPGPSCLVDMLPVSEEAWRRIRLIQEGAFRESVRVAQEVDPDGKTEVLCLVTGYIPIKKRPFPHKLPIEISLPKD